MLAAVSASGWYYFTKSGGTEPKPPIVKDATPPKGGAVVSIPAGPYLAGVSKVSVELPAFSIDRTEVSNQAYSEFAAATGLSAPTGPSNLPVINVSFNQAQSFCKWAGKQLPTESQWEKAARGTDGRTYPWGNDLRADLIIAKENPLAASGPTAVDSLAVGKSPFGALHMAGNVWEWVDRPHSPSPVAVENLQTALSPRLLLSNFGNPSKAVPTTVKSAQRRLINGSAFRLAFRAPTSASVAFLRPSK